MNEIGIRIFWGPWGGEFEPAPVVSVGQVEGEIVPSPPELVKEDQSWMICVDEKKAMYASCSKDLCSNSDGYLQLLICVFIPKGLRLAGKKSPLDLLEEVRRRFEIHFIFNLQAKKPNERKVKADYNQLLKNYALEDCSWYVFYMEGDQAASFCVESRAQLDALMRYNAYPALAHVGHLELGFNCKSTVDINTKGESSDDSKKKKREWWQREKRPQAAPPAQPKPQEKEPKPVKQSVPTSPPKATETIVPPTVQNKGYQICVNGELQNIFLRWNEDEYYLHQESTDDLRYEGLHFKLGELKAAPKRKVATLSGRTVAQLDEKNNRINCEMKPVERWLLKEIAFTPDSDVEARKFVKYNPDKFQVLIGREPWADDRIMPSVAKEAVEKNNIRITPKEAEGYRFSVASAKIAKDRLVVTIEAKNKVKSVGQEKVATETVTLVNDSRRRTFNKKIFVPIILIVTLVASLFLLSLLFSNDGKSDQSVREATEFPYNTHFTGTIGSKGKMTIDSQGEGYYTYDNNGTPLMRNIKVKSYEASSGHLVIDSYGKSNNHIGSFDGYTKNNNYYSGTFRNYKGGSVGFSLFVER